MEEAEQGTLETLFIQFSAKVLVFFYEIVLVSLINLPKQNFPMLNYVYNNKFRKMRTCIPQSLTPRVAEVLAAHLAICLLFFSADASSPCWRVPIFRSKTHGFE